MATLLVALAATITWSCSGGAGKNGVDGKDGTSGSAGPAGAEGQDGVNGVSTGMKIAIDKVTVVADGAITVDFTMADDQGAPVDKEGVYSKGTARPRFGLGRLETPTAGAPVKQYITLTRSTTNPAEPSMLNTANSGTGTVVESPAKSGHYTYTFPASVKIAAGDMAKAHTLFVQNSRQLDLLDPASRYVVNTSLDFVPSGGPVPVTREVVTTQACNTCHNPLAIHGGGRRDVKLCGVCHQNELGNFNLASFAHAIHSRQDLGADGDFSEVTYPREVKDCAACHGGAAQGGQAFTNPSAVACAGCHAYLKFDNSAAKTCDTTGSWGSTTPCNHVLSQGADSKCAICHDAAYVQGKHAPSAVYWKLTNSPPNKADDTAKNPVVKTRIDSVIFDAARIPTFTFTVTTAYNGGPDQPRDLLALPLQTIRVSWATSLAGATAVEYASVLASQRWNIPGWAGTTGAKPVPTATPGQYTWTAPTAVPAADLNGKAFPASQTFAFAIETAEGDEFDPYVVELRGVTSPVFFWRLDNQNSGSNKPLQRRMIVDGAKCFACHGEPKGEQGFGFHHAGSRNNVQQCAFCHDAVTTDQRTTRLPPASGTERRLDQSIQLSVMVHKMHLGQDSKDAFSWKYYSNSGVALERAAYPGNLIDCDQCHVTPSSPATAVWGLPLNAAVYPTTKSIWYDCAANTNTPYDGCVAKETVLKTQTVAVCNSCHDSPAATAHMQQHVAVVDGTPTETCTVCHGQYKDVDVRKVHKANP